MDNLVTIDRNVCRIVAWQQLILPAMVLSFGIVAKFPINIVSLMVVTATAGSVFASPAFALLLGLDRRQALQGMVMSTLMTPLSLYLGLTLLYGSSVNLNLDQYLERTAIFLVLPMLIFLAYRPIAKRMSEPALNAVFGFSRWAALWSLLVFGLGVMADLPVVAKVAPLKLLFYLLIVTTLCSAMLLLTTIVMYRHGRNHALTAAVLAAFRNVGLGFALLGESVNPDLDMYVGVSMIPLFLAPIILRLITAERHPAGVLA
jgi:hypothetical protein